MNDKVVLFVVHLQYTNLLYIHTYSVCLNNKLMEKFN